MAPARTSAHIRAYPAYIRALTLRITPDTIHD